MINDAKTVFLITFAIYTKDKLKTANVISDDFAIYAKVNSILSSICDTIRTDRLDSSLVKSICHQKSIRISKR